MTVALLVLAGVLALADWVAVARHEPRVRWITKPGTMVALIAAAVAGSDGVAGDVRWWLLAGLVLSLAGDVFLMLPERWFVAGLAAFLVAHLAYITGMVQIDFSGFRALIGVAVVAVMAAVVGRAVVAGAARSDRTMRVPVTAYVTVISAMVIVACGTGEPWLIAAAVLFYCSDSILGWNRFVRPAAWMPLAVMVTYHLAQGGFTAFLVTR